jgi:hypothetical protein
VSIAVILGAGFSRQAGVPLASQLFARAPEVDRISRQRLVDRVLARWEAWHARTGRTPEEYLAELQQQSVREWADAVWYVGLVIALAMGTVQHVGLQPTIVHHNVDRTTGNLVHEAFWSRIFRRTEQIAVVTTNYDILAERGLRHVPRPRVPRPGFHYGSGPESLAGGGYPSYAHIQQVSARGRVPLHKLHGSVSWSVRNGRLVRYHDCRPAIRGDAAIVAPVVDKLVPTYLEPTWTQAQAALQAARAWIVVGYSLPAYDLAVRDLLRRSASPDLTIDIFDPNPAVAGAYQDVRPGPARSHPCPASLTYPSP